MPSKEFDFDRFFSEATFAQVEQLMFRARRKPSMRSPDGTWLYLSSVDEQVATDDADSMRFVLGGILDRLAVLKASNELDHREISTFEIDRTELESRLHYL